MSVDWSRLPSKRTALRAFVVSIVVSALLGIWALLAGGFGDLQIKVLLSSLSVSAASLCAMGGAALLEARGERWLSVSAILLAGGALFLVLTGMWGEVDELGFWKTTSTACFFAVAFAHASLLRLARLVGRHAWLAPTMVALVLSLAAYGSLLVWAEADDETAYRVLGVLSILVAAGTLATPVFHRLGRDDLATAGAVESDGAVALLCPRCSARLREPLGEIQCAHCQERFRVELVDP